MPQGACCLALRHAGIGCDLLHGTAGAAVPEIEQDLHIGQLQIMGRPCDIEVAVEELGRKIEEPERVCLHIGIELCGHALASELRAQRSGQDAAV